MHDLGFGPRLRVEVIRFHSQVLPLAWTAALTDIYGRVDSIYESYDSHCLLIFASTLLHVGTKKSATLLTLREV